MSLVIGIFDKDVEYSSQLMAYVKRKHRNIRQVRIFTNKTILYDYLSDNKINVLLISEDKLEEGIDHDNIGDLCVLSEGNLVSEKDELRAIYKYQSAEQIIKELFTLFPELKINRQIHFSKNTKVISIFSLKETYAKDTYSFSLANQYGKMKKTLLINFNLLHGSSEFTNGGFDKNLSGFLYYLKAQNSDVLTKMNEQVQRMANFSYLQGVTFGPDIYELTPKDLEFWMEELRKCDYEVIIFNVGCFFQTTLKLFRQSQELLLVTKRDVWEKSLYNNFKDQLSWTGYDDVIEKINLVNSEDVFYDVRPTERDSQAFTKSSSPQVDKYAAISG